MIPGDIRTRGSVTMMMHNLLFLELLNVGIKHLKSHATTETPRRQCQSQQTQPQPCGRQPRVNIQSPPALGQRMMDNQRSPSLSLPPPVINGVVHQAKPQNRGSVSRRTKEARLFLIKLCWIFKESSKSSQLYGGKRN